MYKNRPRLTPQGIYIDHDNEPQNLWEQCELKEEEIKRLKGELQVQKIALRHHVALVKEHCERTEQ